MTALRRTTEGSGPLTNFGWVLDGELAGSGRVDRVESALLLEQGVRAILSLTEWDPASPDGLAEGIHHLHLPVPDMTAPGDSEIESAVAFIDACLAEDRPVAVHCGAGYGRTGTILACYLVRRGADPADAIRDVRVRRPGSIETPSQEDAIHRYAFRLAEGS